MATEISSMTTPDGRELEYLVSGPRDGRALVLHAPSPSKALDFSGILNPAGALGLRTISYSRPGYGSSAERVGRSVASAAEDVAALLDALGVHDFVTLGWSGGGPHSLACAALLPGRCRAATLVASLAPHSAAGLEFMAGMTDDNREEWGVAVAGFDELDAYLQPFRAHFQELTVTSLVADLEGAVSEPDMATLTGSFADELATAFRRAVETGMAGWRDDDLAFVRSWGFEVAGVTVPVAIWHGDDDWIVPFAHGEWLAGEIGGARFHRLAGEGHLSPIHHFEAILAELVALGDS